MDPEGTPYIPVGRIPVAPTPTFTRSAILSLLADAIQQGREESYLSSPDDVADFEAAQRAVERALERIEYVFRQTLR